MPAGAAPRPLKLPLILLAVLEENAILKQRLENQAKVEAEMFPK